MSDNKIQMVEKENPPRKKEEYSTLTITVSLNGEPKNERTSKSTSLKMPMPLVRKVEGPFTEEGKLVEEMMEGQEYIFKATEFQKSTLTPIKHIWWAEKIDDGDIVDLEYKRNENPYLDDKKVVCFKYKAKKAEKIRIYAYVASPAESVSIASKVMLKKVVVFFIGGAGDKEEYYGQGPTMIVNREVQKEFYGRIKKQKLTNYYIDEFLSYKEVKGEDDIKNKVLSIIPNKDNTSVYIVGHSLGGWNGAHLSQILTDKGYNVDLLITLDPVGTGVGVSLISDIFFSAPKPKANYWINVHSDPEEYEADDFIADLGGQWTPSNSVKINHQCKCNHRSAGLMFKDSLKGNNISASDMLIQFIKHYLKNEK